MRIVIAVRGGENLKRILRLAAVAIVLTALLAASAAPVAARTSCDHSTPNDFFVCSGGTGGGFGQGLGGDGGRHTVSNDFSTTTNVGGYGQKGGGGGGYCQRSDGTVTEHGTRSLC
jgi:hypothetical protein